MSGVRLSQLLIGSVLLSLLVAASTVVSPALASGALQQATPTAADVFAALIAAGDLPSSYEALTSAELDNWGLTTEQLALRNGTAKLYRAAYVESTTRNAVLHVILHPIGVPERLAYDRYLDPRTGPAALARFLMGADIEIADVELIPDLDKLGDRSLGITFVFCVGSSSTRTRAAWHRQVDRSPSAAGSCDPGTNAYRSDVVLERRDTAISLIQTVYVDGAAAGADSGDLARLVDERLVTALGTANLPSPTARPPAHRPVLLNASFDRNENEWPTGETKDQFGVVKRSIQDGKYRWEATADRGVIWRGMPLAKAVSNFDLSVDARRISGLKTAVYGIVFCHDGANYGFFEIRDDELFSVELRYQGGWDTAIDWTHTPAIRAGEINRLTVRREGSRFSFFVNGQWVGQAVIDKLIAGRPGLGIALDTGESAVYEFDNLTLSALPEGLRLYGSDPLSLDPALAGDENSAVYLVELFGGLVTLAPDLKVVPDLADKWEVSQDGTVYTFHLRSNAKFHDGRPVTAQDVQYSFERVADPKTKAPSASLYLGDIVGVNDKLSGKASTIRGLQVVDDRTVQITIDAPKSYFLSKLAKHQAFVVDKANVERDGAKWTQKPNGTGPYKLKEYVARQRLVLEKNEHYYLDPKPQIASVTFVLSSTSLTQYASGDLDVFLVGTSNANRVRDPKDPLSREAVMVSRLSTSYVVFNVRKPPFDDLKVRQAFALAIDRQSVIAEQYAQVPLLSKSILPLPMPGYNPSRPDIAYDPARARQLLAESKYAGQLPVIIWRKAITDTVAPAMANMVKTNLGVDVVLQQDDSAAYLANIKKSDNPYNIFNSGWIADYADPDNFVGALFSSRSGDNASGYADPQVDGWIAQAAAETDPNRRIQLYQQAETKILGDSPVVPFMQNRYLWLVKPYVKGLPFPAIPLPRLRYAYFAGELNPAPKQ